MAVPCVAREIKIHALYTCNSFTCTCAVQHSSATEKDNSGDTNICMYLLASVCKTQSKEVLFFSPSNTPTTNELQIPILTKTIACE